MSMLDHTLKPNVTERWLEVITETGRRSWFSKDDKAWIIEEALVPGSVVSEITRRRNNRGALPAHLPRIEVVVDLGAKTCPCCKGDLLQIGEDKSERLDMMPAQLRVVVTRRPKHACRACEDGVSQAEAPPG